MRKIQNLKFKIQNSRGGFTLIELMIVMTVMAILAIIVLYGLGQAQKSARDQQRAQIVKGVQTALQSALADTGSYPAAVGGWSPDYTASYLNSGAMNDPMCGAGQAAVDIRTTGTVGCGGVVYTYARAAGTCPAGTPYNITLAKEAGGTQTFCGPR